MHDKTTDMISVINFICFEFIACLNWNQLSGEGF